MTFFQVFFIFRTFERENPLIVHFFPVLGFLNANPCRLLSYIGRLQPYSGGKIAGKAPPVSSKKEQGEKKRQRQSRREREDDH